jgi:hypothetical protein
MDHTEKKHTSTSSTVIQLRKRDHHHYNNWHVVTVTERWRELFHLSMVTHRGIDYQKIVGPLVY